MWYITSSCMAKEQQTKPRPQATHSDGGSTSDDTHIWMGWTSTTSTTTSYVGVFIGFCRRRTGELIHLHMVHMFSSTPRSLLQTPGENWKSAAQLLSLRRPNWAVPVQQRCAWVHVLMRSQLLETTLHKYMYNIYILWRVLHICIEFELKIRTQH